MSGEANEDVVNQIAEAVVKNDPAGNLVIEDNYGWYLNLSNEQREDILGKPYLNEIIDENIDRIAESWDDQFMSEGSERFAAGNSNHWMTFGRVDYNWATDPDDIPLTDEEFWEIDEYIRNEIRYEIDTNNLPGESEVSSWTLSMTPDEGEEFIIYYYWGPAQTTGVNSAEDFIERHQEDPAGLLEAEGEEIYWNASCEPCYWENRFISTDKGQLPDRCPFCEKAVTMVAVDVENNLLAAEESVDFACPLCGAKDSLFPVLGHYGETAYECQQCRQLMGGGY
jgi:hypothetical protein